MLCGAICLSHSPLMHHNRAPAEIEAGWNDAVSKAREFIREIEATHCVIFFPDHVNGFFYNLLPPFCVGAAGSSLGDFGTVPGPIDIPESLAADCHAYCVAHEVDAAISYDMTIDHGATQAFEALSGDGHLQGFLPIFVNCIAAPMPSFERARTLGRVVGNWAMQRPERFVFVGSGGLSHDPPLPNLETAVGRAAERLRKGGPLSYSERLARQHRVLSEGKLLRSGQSAVKPLNPDWDRETLGKLASGRLDILDELSAEALAGIAGNGANELRTWVAALEAVGAYETKTSFYEPVDEWITGMGMLIVQPKEATASASQSAV